jgi:hypothetical protein
VIEGAINKEINNDKVKCSCDAKKGKHGLSQMEEGECNCGEAEEAMP